MRITSIQLEIRDRPKVETLRHVLALLERARGSDLVLLPEIWPCGAFCFDRFAADSEPIDGPLVQALQEQARQLNAHLLTGSFVERAGRDLFNTMLLLGPRGQVLARYRKVHLFGYQSEESRLLKAGNEVVVAETPWGPMGLSICYDLRFPELYRRMVDQGARFFLVASGWPAARRESWVLFNRARANENLAFLFSCNSAGYTGGLRYGGHSLIVDPLGQVIAEGGEEECLVTAEVDPARVDQIRTEFPALQDRVLR